MPKVLGFVLHLHFHSYLVDEATDAHHVVTFLRLYNWTVAKLGSDCRCFFNIITQILSSGNTTIISTIFPPS